MTIRPSSLPRRRTRPSGFTIIELLVALSVTALMAGLMLNVILNVLNSWNRSSGSLSTGNQARLILDQLATDLQGAIFRRDSNAWLVATAQRDQSGLGDAAMDSVFKAIWTVSSPGSVKPSGSISLKIPASPTDFAASRFGQAGVWLRFFSTPPDTNSGGLSQVTAPRAIAYQLVRGRVGSTGGQEGYFLYRSEVKPDLTFTTGYDLLMPTNTSPGYNAGDATDGNAGNVRRPTFSRVLASGVIDFGIRFFEPDAANPALQVEKFPVTRNTNGVIVGATPSATPFSYVVSARTTAVSGVTGVEANPTKGFPVAAEVMVRILTDEGVRQIRAFEQDATRFPGKTWWDIAEPNSNVYTRRIDFRTTAF